MPLKSGSSQKTISSNIKELHSGKTFAHTEGKFGKARADKQAVAIALSESRGRALGGVAPMMAQAFNPAATMPQSPTGGMSLGVSGTGQSMPGQNPEPLSPFSRPMKAGGVAEPGTSKSVKMTTGPLVSTVPGRTDLHFTHVPSGAYVIPADVVSGRGQGNTLAGIEALHKFFDMDSATSGSPSVAAQRHFAKGGTADEHVGKPVPVKLAGGEIVVPPEKLHKTMERVYRKKMTLEEAHSKMDGWVVAERKKLRKTLAKLPGPVKN